MRFLRSLHKWLGLIVGAQLILWTISGFMFSWLDHHEVMAEHSVRNLKPVQLPVNLALTEPSAWLGQYGNTEIRGVTLLPLLDTWFWRVQTAERVELRRADTGERFTFGDAFVRRLAEARYIGNARAAEAVQHTDETMEARDAGPVWSVRFDDERRTTLYFSASDGRFVAARNDTWRLFDVFWMLHTMDYRGRDNFNNPLVIFAGTGALWLGLSGFILLFRAFRLYELNPIVWFRGPPSIPVRISASGKQAREIPLPVSESLYTALKTTGIDLPSNCGGGGSCGLCVVRFASAAPTPTSEERHFIGKADLNCGYRLACRHVPTRAEIELPDSAVKHREWSAKISETRQLTPTIKELRLKVPQQFAFRAGDYVQIEIPSAGGVPVRRAYSMANAPHEQAAIVVLNVRLAAAPAHSLPGGVGSTFLFNAEAGARLRVLGPFGTFHAQESGRGMMFIGGGAGMAPIRSIIVDQLRARRTTREIHFWYGARSPEELYYDDELNELAREFANFRWHPTCSEASGSAAAGHIGHVHEVVRREYLSAEHHAAACDWYLCGPPRMLDACRKMLKAAGVPDEQVFFDDFGS
jgi:Na+-transporting NADH:ubiquinone oxidoreductase subunit F